MGTYSIKELEKLSGIKAHTIRIWEKRYNIVSPQRTQSNIRLYSDSDLKRIINVSLLNTHGIKISIIAEMSDEEVNKRVVELSETKEQLTVHVDRLVTGMIDLNEQAFVNELASLEQKFGFESTVVNILYPFLEKIGVLWQTDSITPAHEHFISNLIRQKVIVAIASLPVPSNATLRALLFLPEGELHEIGLLFYHYIARKHGVMTYYLGQSVPHEDLQKVGAVHRPHFLITSLTAIPSVQQLNDYLQMLSNDFPDSRILASGALLRNSFFKSPPNVKPFHSAIELKEILSNLK